jgi:hypothetical protein
MKLCRIESQGCDIFIDDLLNLLNDNAFPDGVKRLWFSPNNSFSSTKKFTQIKHVSSWNKIDYHIQDLSTSYDDYPSNKNIKLYYNTKRYKTIEMLCEFAKHSLNVRLCDHQMLKGGINNKVVKLVTANGYCLIGKIYKRSLKDPRDRLMHETRFLNLLEKAGIDCVPRVLAVDESRGMAIHTEVKGRIWPENIPVPSDIWQQFSRFLDQIQEAIFLPESKDIPFAAEAAMSLQEHLGWVQQRRDLWRSRALNEDLSPKLKCYILEDLEKEYNEITEAVIIHPKFRYNIPFKQLILTPSDFGLHNALVTSQGTLNFIDFEYAGWDDPAKTNIDFTLQPRYRVGRPQQIDCLKNKLDLTDSRIRLIQKLLSLKWRYIILAARLSALNQ